MGHPATSNPGRLTIFHPAVSTREDYPGTGGHFFLLNFENGFGRRCVLRPGSFAN